MKGKLITGASVEKLSGEKHVTALKPSVVLSVCLSGLRIKIVNFLHVCVLFQGAKPI